MTKRAISIDFGGTSTDVILTDDKRIVSMQSMISPPCLDALYLTRILEQFPPSSSRFERIIVTGGLSHQLPASVNHIPLTKINEIEAIGRGGLFLAQRARALVVSLGTGTAIVSTHMSAAKHIIGTGLGGGTIMGLGHALLAIDDFQRLEHLAQNGDASTVDLSVGDIVGNAVQKLPPKSTAANFGKLCHARRRPAKRDIARAIFTLVGQSIATLALMTARVGQRQPIVVIGRTAESALLRSIMCDVSDLFGGEFIFPSSARYGAALGASLVAGIPIKLPK
jgi:type II pantothenate kinase